MSQVTTLAKPMSALPLGNAFRKVPISLDEVVLVAIYLRVSTTGQVQDGFGLETQREINFNYVLRFPNWRVFDVYTDGGVSGTLTEREDMDRLLRDAETNPIRFVIVARLDRQSREEYVGYYLDRQLADRGVTLVSATQDSNPYEVSTLARGVQRVIDAEDRRKIIDNTNRGRQKAAEAGYWVGGRTPFGYRSTGGKRAMLVIEEREASVIKRAAELLLVEGKSLHETVAALNAEGRYTRFKKPWTAANLRARLLSDGVAGKSVFRKVSEKDGRSRAKTGPDGAPSLGDSVVRTLPEILTPQQHTALRTALRLRNVGPKQTYLLTGMIFGDCGSHYLGSSIRGKRRYDCAASSCTDRSFDAEVVENYVWSKLAAFLKDPACMRVLAEDWIAKLPSDHERHRVHKDALAVEVEKKRKMLEGLTLQLLEQPDHDERIILEGSKVTLMAAFKESKAALEQVTRRLETYDAARANVTRVVELVTNASLRVDAMNFIERRTLLTLLNIRVTLRDQDARRSTGPANPLETWHRQANVLIPSDPDDAAWEKILEMLHARKSRLVQYQVPRESLRLALCAMLHRLRTGCAWSDVPKELWGHYTDYQTIRGLQSRLWQKGLWPEIIMILGSEGTPIATPELLPKLRITGRFNPAILEAQESSVAEDELSSPGTFEFANFMEFELEAA